MEAEVAAQEATVAQLEEKLAADWADVDALAAHPRRARDELRALLVRWKRSFDQAQA